jgi:hypothetical protein
MSAPPTNNDNPPNGGAGEWRQSIAQSFRSEEIRSIANVLASLEPGATSASKLMLANKFEDSIFKSATDFDDYRKTIQKRIKKLQKHYAKQQSVAGGGGGDKGVVENADLAREKELLLESELREKFGSRLLYIAANADNAVRLKREREGDHKADILLQHATNSNVWAVQLGLQLPACVTGLPARPERLDMESLKKLKEYLENRV